PSFLPAFAYFYLKPLSFTINFAILKSMNLSADPDNIFLLEQLAEHSGNAFFLFDVDRKQFRYVSPAFESIWEQERAAFAPGFSAVLGTVLPADRAFVLRSWNWYLNPKRGCHKTFEFRIVLPDGRLKWVFAELFLLRNEDESFCISGWARNVTEQKNYLEVLRKYAARKNAVLEVLTHDLSGFLALIRNLTDTIPAGLQAPGNSEITAKLELIKQTSLRGAELITDLVNNEFIDSARVTLNRQRIDLVLQTTDIVKMFRAGHNEKGTIITIETNKPQIYLQLDGVKFMQVINNLISNAVKFTPEGGQVRIWLESRPGTVLFQISDTGIGIPEALQPVLFDRFTEARRPGLRGEPCVGLGLSIIKSIVELHGGRIWFSSRESEGSTFYIELPKV
ncbi:MAG TPA: PAS domain-containing sensor histidine kinase, partial [Adhaeribacter sp.]|nr:PAS domain-containing sensor histidine kinase [Adhaeribacter sp.]